MKQLPWSDVDMVHSETCSTPSGKTHRNTQKDNGQPTHGAVNKGNGYHENTLSKKTWI